jgi:hypothetical protein
MALNLIPTNFVTMALNLIPTSRLFFREKVWLKAQERCSLPCTWCSPGRQSTSGEWSEHVGVELKFKNLKIISFSQSLSRKCNDSYLRALGITVFSPSFNPREEWNITVQESCSKKMSKISLSEFVQNNTRWPIF